MDGLPLFALDPLPVWVAVALTAALLAHAAAAKASNRALLEQHLSAYGVPFASLTLVAVLLIAAESAAALLLLSPWRAAGAGLAALLLLVYGAAMAWHRSRGRAIDCGCGGAPIPVSWVLVARNALLVVVALAAGAPMSGRAMTMLDFAAVAGALLLGALLYAALHEVLRHQHRVTERRILRRL